MKLPDRTGPRKSTYDLGSPSRPTPPPHTGSTRRTRRGRPYSDVYILYVGKDVSEVKATDGGTRLEGDGYNRQSTRLETTTWERDDLRHRRTARQRQGNPGREYRRGPARAPRLDR